MNTVFSVLGDFVRFFSFKTKWGRIRLILLLILLVTGGVFLKSGTEEATEPVKADKAVHVAKVASFSEGTAVQLIGTVSATNRAVIQSEAAGRVVRVPVSLGDTVSVGEVIAQLENASEYASVLQAEGAHEAALAAAQVSDVSSAEATNAQKTAQNAAVAAYRNSYTTVSNIVFNTLDDFFGDPYFSTPGVKINVGADISYLNTERSSFNDVLQNWQKKTVTLQVADNLDESLTEATLYTQRVLRMVDVFIKAIEQEDAGATLNGVSLSTYADTLSSIRTTLNATLAALDASGTSLQSAREIVKKAELGGTTSDVSAANAQVKQALGMLRSAQAEYNKTILRSPISGVVNTIDVQTGDFVSSFQKVAEIANNEALEVTTFVGQSDRAQIEVLQEVSIEGVASGVISTIAPAVNPATGKIEVKIQSTSDKLVNGDTVSIALEGKATNTENTVVLVPITAVKFTADAGSVFTVVDGMLETHAVEIGSVRDMYIEIISGVTNDTEIVVDARGLTHGQKVTTISN